jgi:hypothetical protein
MQAVRTAIVVIAAMAVGSCHSAPLPRPGAPVPKSIALERTICFGRCPAYQLTVNRAGGVSFVSRNREDSGRMGIGQVASTVLDSLYTRAIRIGFFALPDTLMADSTYCAQRATDMPSATVTIVTDSGAKSVVDYHGCFAKLPAATEKLNELRAFEAAIDTLTGSSRWTQPPNP